MATGEPRYRIVPLDSGGGSEQEDDTLMGDDDIRAWNPSELGDEDEDDYDDAESDERIGDEDAGAEEVEGAAEDRGEVKPRDSYFERQPPDDEGRKMQESTPLDFQEAENSQHKDDNDDIQEQLFSTITDNSTAGETETCYLDPDEDEHSSGNADEDEGEVSTSSWLDVGLPESSGTLAEAEMKQPLSLTEATTEAERYPGHSDISANQYRPNGQLVAQLSSIEVTDNSNTSDLLAVAEAPIAPVHPIPLLRTGSFPAPLSPSSSPHRRSNSLYTTPNLASNALMKPHSSATLQLRKSQLWELDPARRSSRLLDEWKRKEIWHDFKRAEEHVACPTGKKLETPLPVESQSLSIMNVSVSEHQESTQLPQQVRGTPNNQIKRKDPESPRKSFSNAIPKIRRESSWSSPTSSPTRSKTTERRQSGSVDSTSNAPARTLAGSIAAICNVSKSSSIPSPTVNVSTIPSVAVSPASTVSLTDYEQLIKEKLALQAETESYRRAALLDKDTIQLLNEQLKHLETLERENKFLKDEAQKQMMQNLNSSEAMKTLNDQLMLRGKCEEQLKLQTKQLMEQNQSLQADLLEKIAAETDKIQKMARLSAEKQSLIQELEEKDISERERKDLDRRKARRRLLLRLVKRKHRVVMLSTMLRWKINAREVAVACFKISNVLNCAAQRSEIQRKSRAFRLLLTHSLSQSHKHSISTLNTQLECVSGNIRAQQIAHAVIRLNSVVEQIRLRRLSSALRTLEYFSLSHRYRVNSTSLGLSALGLLISSKTRASIQRAWAKWHIAAHSDKLSMRYEKSQEVEDRLTEAKECVFLLSKAKTKLEEKLQSARDECDRLTNQVVESNAELRLAKHGYVAVILRGTERSWVREFFASWREYTSVSLGCKQLRLQVQMAELRVAEREKHAKSLDDYTRVLKNDLERFQFFSQDKRVAVEVLTKKLSKVETRYREMEEQHAVTEERAHSLKNQLSAFVDWEGTNLPFAILVLCKDLAVGNLCELFAVYASTPSTSKAIGSTASMSSASSLFSFANDNNSAKPRDTSPDNAIALRLSVDSLVHMLECSSIMMGEPLVAREQLQDRLLPFLPSYAAERGILFHDFVSGVNDFVNNIIPPTDRKYGQCKQFWSSLLGLMSTIRASVSAGNNGNGFCTIGAAIGGIPRAAMNGNVMAYGPQSSAWAGRLSEDILQNQEKLLAVLEHETAVVERAVMEKTSLKHTYPPPTEDDEDCAPGARTTFFEYQCDPLLPPDHVSASAPPSSLAGPTNGSEVTSSPLMSGSAQKFLEKYANWHAGAQIRDVFLACHRPLLKILVQYSDARRDPRHGNQYCLEHAAVIRMLEDMRLSPSFLSREAIGRLFGCFRSPSDGLLPPQGFAMFLGACALEIYATTHAEVSASKPQTASPYLLSAREVLLSFFGDLGLLVESDVPPPSRLAFVGMDVEAILWPLFEYYATSGGSLQRAEDDRVGMTIDTFTAFMAEIANAGETAPAIFHRTLLETKRDQSRRKSKSCEPNESTISAAKDMDTETASMYLDDFYFAISLIQAQRVPPGATFTSPGEAVRQWMQQTQ